MPPGLVEVLETGDTAGNISTAEIGCDIVLWNDPEVRLPDWVLHTRVAGSASSASSGASRAMTPS
jgi:hypothetical protein